MKKSIIILSILFFGCEKEKDEPICLFPFVESNYKYEEVKESICVLAIHNDDTIVSGKWHLLGYKYLKDSLEHCQTNFFIDYCKDCNYCN
jgi:hypothetical protein